MTTREKIRRGPRGTKSRQAMTRPTFPRSCGGNEGLRRAETSFEHAAFGRSVKSAKVRFGISLSIARRPVAGASVPVRRGGPRTADSTREPDAVTTRLAYTRSTRQCPGKSAPKRKQQEPEADG
jgi:hypothetical protein